MVNELSGSIAAIKLCRASMNPLDGSVQVVIVMCMAYDATVSLTLDTHAHEGYWPLTH